MKLLIITQAVDKNDPVLGFFHRWLEEFSRHFEGIEVVCLKEGEHALPSNVRVHSLGKEKGKAPRIVYALRFFRLIWNLRRAYDAVFVHMNQEYVLFGAPLWKLAGKRVYMWRNHYAGSILTDIAVGLCTKVFCTSKHSYTAKFKRTVLMPVGVDTDTFKPDLSIMRTPLSILSLGRISPSKNIGTLIEALQLLSKRGIAYTADIYGDALPADRGYLEYLKETVKTCGLDTVLFRGSVRNSEAPRVYASHRIFVNASRSGMFDKTLFEAAACGCTVLASSRDFAELFGAGGYFAEGNSEELAHKLEEHLTAETPAGEGYRGVVSSHSLRELGKALAAQIS